MHGTRWLLAELARCVGSPEARRSTDPRDPRKATVSNLGKYQDIVSAAKQQGVSRT